MWKDYVSMKPFEVRCSWWRPESPELSVPGLVGFDGTDIVASMDDWVGPEKVFELPRADMLHAETIDGVSVTLYDAFVSSVKSEVRLVVNSMAVGEHIQSDQRFSNAVARINGLDSWWRRNAVKSELSADRSVSVQCSAPWSIKMSIPDRFLTITVGENVRCEHKDKGRSFNICYEPVIRFLPEKPQTLGWMKEVVEEVRQLISLFMNQETSLTGLHLKPKSGEDTLGNVELYWNRHESVPREIRESKILLKFDGLRDQLKDVLSNWLCMTKTLRHTRSLLFSTQANPGSFLETRFLPIIQALEVYCRNLGSEKYVAENEFAELKKQLLEFVPSDLDAKLQQKLRTSIGFANELSLNDRILQLLHTLDEETRCFVCQDGEKFSRLLKDSRNYYTHYGDSRGRELSGNALHWATEQVALLLKILLLKGCGVSESLIQQCLTQSWHHKQGMQIWTDLEKDL